MRNPQRLSVPIRLDRNLAEPLHEQLVDQLRRAIDTGQLAQGTRMPSTRTLSGILGISRGVALTAYELLLARGYITGRQGSGTYVSAKSRREQPTAPRQSRVSREPIDMYPGLPSPEGFPISEWRAAWRRAGHHVPPIRCLPRLGLPDLREALAAHLRDSRGLMLDHHEIVVAAGYSNALQLILQATGRRSPVIGLEDPAPAWLASTLRRNGRIVPVQVDGSGARADQIPNPCDVMVVMPERNDPLGTQMSMRRRQALTAFGGLLIEPAVDGVFNSRLAPKPSLLAMGNPLSTVMVGTFSTILTPTLPLAYIVAPRRLAEAIAAIGPEPSAMLTQLAVTELLASGCITRRVNRLSVLYARKRAIVRQALAGAPLVGCDTGSAATLMLPSHVKEDLMRRVRVADLGSYCRGRSRSGIVFGFGHLDDVTLRRGLSVIRESLSQIRTVA